MFEGRNLSPNAQAVILICLLGMLMFSVGIILLPGYLEFLASRQQKEAVSNLREICKAERRYFDRNRRYADSFVELSYAPIGAYTYYLGQEVHERDGKYYPLPANVSTWANNDGFRAVAALNLDEDPDLDIWTVDEKGRIAHICNDFTWPHLKDYPKEIGRLLKKKK